MIMDSKVTNPVEIPAPRVVFYVNSKPIEYEDYIASIILCNMRNQHRGIQVSAIPKHKFEAQNIFHQVKRTKCLSDSMDGGNQNREMQVSAIPKNKFEANNISYQVKRTKCLSDSMDSGSSSIYYKDTDEDELSVNMKINSSSSKRTGNTRNSYMRSNIRKSFNIRYKYDKKLKSEEISSKLVYHGKMARIYPDVENRTPEQIEYRKKNCFSSRVSRARAKMIEEQFEMEASKEKLENLNCKRTLAAFNVYANQLLRKLGKHETDWSAKWKMKV